MRQREREQLSSSPAPSVPPVLPRNGGGLSSKVVRLSDNGGGGSENGPDPGNGRDSGDERKELSPPRRRSESPRGFSSRRGSPPVPRRRGSPPPNFHLRDSPIGLKRRGSPPRFSRRESPTDLRSRSPRFHENPGSISPSQPRRMDAGDYYDEHFDRPFKPHFRHGMRGGRGGGRYGDGSPPYGTGRGGRSFGRGHDMLPRRELPPLEGDYVLRNNSNLSPREGRGGRSFGRSHDTLPRRDLPPLEADYAHRNDPNLSPREGDWICRNPSCGNLNFARRSYCNNCNEFRYQRIPRGTSRSPQRDFYGPPARASPPRISSRPVEPGVRRNTKGFGSPRRSWVSEDPRSFRAGSPPKHGRPFSGHIPRERFDYRVDYYKERRKADWQGSDDWASRNDERAGFPPERRGFDRRMVSPRGGWFDNSRERSRSPLRGGGRGDRRFDGGYLEQRQRSHQDIGQGQGYQRRD